MRLGVGMWIIKAVSVYGNIILCFHFTRAKMKYKQMACWGAHES